MIKAFALRIVVGRVADDRSAFIICLLERVGWSSFYALGGYLVLVVEVEVVEPKRAVPEPLAVAVPPETGAISQMLPDVDVDDGWPFSTGVTAQVPLTTGGLAAPPVRYGKISIGDGAICTP